MENKIGFQIASTQFEAMKAAAFATINAYVKHEGIKWFDEYHKGSVFSDAYTKLLNKGELFDPNKASFLTWFKRVTLFALIDYIRGQRPWEPLFWENEEGDLYEREELSFGITPEMEMIGRESEDAYVRCMDSRGQLEKELMDLSRKGYSPKEIAELYGMTPTAVSMRLFKSRAELKGALAA
ncbi:MAG: sigma-70 family RNA polymerase sigma factor [Bacteroidales bacterium]|nr:sigma-70 family RNA polymerase sigma factor [Bacteroidales bacterium]